MTISDPTFAASLAGISTPQELRDPSGRLLGRYVPATPNSYAWTIPNAPTSTARWRGGSACNATRNASAML